MVFEKRQNRLARVQIAAGLANNDHRQVLRTTGPGVPTIHNLVKRDLGTRSATRIPLKGNARSIVRRINLRLRHGTQAFVQVAPEVHRLRCRSDHAAVAFGHRATRLEHK